MSHNSKKITYLSGSSSKHFDSVEADFSFWCLLGGFLLRRRHEDGSFLGRFFSVEWGEARHGRFDGGETSSWWGKGFGRMGSDGQDGHGGNERLVWHGGCGLVIEIELKSNLW